MKIFRETPNKLEICIIPLTAWIVLIILAAIPWFLTLTRATVPLLVCTRSMPGQGECEYQEAGTFRTETKFRLPLSEIEGVEVGEDGTIKLLTKKDDIALPFSDRSIASQIDTFLNSPFQKTLKLGNKKYLFVNPFTILSLILLTYLILAGNVAGYRFNKQGNQFLIHKTGLFRHKKTPYPLTEVVAIQMEGTERENSRIVVELRSGDRIPLGFLSRQPRVEKQRIVSRLRGFLGLLK